MAVGLMKLSFLERCAQKTPGRIAPDRETAFHLILLYGDEKQIAENQTGLFADQIGIRLAHQHMCVTASFRLAQKVHVNAGLEHHHDIASSKKEIPHGVSFFND